MIMNPFYRQACRLTQLAIELSLYSKTYRVLVGSFPNIHFRPFIGRAT